MRPTLPALSKHLSSTPFKRSQTGLFHGSLIQFGNNVPFSKHKTRRTWLPNIQSKGLFSELLGKELDVKVTARSLRIIRKYGGLDQYILNTRHELLGPEGMRIRLMLRSKQEKLAQNAQEETHEGAATESNGESLEGKGSSEASDGAEEAKVDGEAQLDSTLTSQGGVEGLRSTSKDEPDRPQATL